MKQRLQLTSACVLAAFLTSCSTTGTGGTTGTAMASSTGTGKYTATQDELKTIQEARFSYTVDGVWKGAATGAATGAITAAVTGGDVRDSAIKGGIGGGLAGGLMGFRTGDQKGNEKVAQKRTQKDNETIVREQIEVMQKINEAASTALVKLRTDMKSATDPKERAQIKAMAAKYVKAMSDKIAITNGALNDEELKPIEGYTNFKKVVLRAGKLKEELLRITTDDSDQKLS